MTPLTDRLMRLSKRLEDEGFYVNANLVHEAAKRLNAAEGYLLNAKIDLETTTPKRTALNTIEGGLRMLRDDLTETAEAGKCPYCETKMVNSGAPIWEDYCPNKDCTGHRDALIASIRERLAETVRQERIRDAAPDMLAALEFVQSDPCFGQLGSVTQDEVRLALSRAKGEE